MCVTEPWFFIWFYFRKLSSIFYIISTVEAFVVCESHQKLFVRLFIVFVEVHIFRMLALLFVLFVYVIQCKCVCSFNVVFLRFVLHCRWEQRLLHVCHIFFSLMEIPHNIEDQHVLKKWFVFVFYVMCSFNVFFCIFYSPLSLRTAFIKSYICNCFYL